MGAETWVPHAILLVEDDADQREALAVLLGTRGYAVTAASTGRAGLDLLAKGLRPCVIVIDFTMPGMNAVEFAQNQHEHGDATVASIPLILYSGDTDLSVHARTMGAVAHVRKPDVERLFSSIGLLC